MTLGFTKKQKETQMGEMIHKRRGKQMRERVEMEGG